MPLWSWKKKLLTMFLALVFFGLAFWSGPTQRELGVVERAFQRLSIPAEHLICASLGRDKSPYFQEALLVEASDLQKGLRVIEQDGHFTHDANGMTPSDSDSNYDRLAYVLALAYDLEGGNPRVKLNKGSKHGLAEGMPLLSPQGYLGRLTHVDDYFSIAGLAKDEQACYPVENLAQHQGLAYNYHPNRGFRLKTKTGSWWEKEDIFIREDRDSGQLLLLGSAYEETSNFYVRPSADILEDRLLFVLLENKAERMEGSNP